MLNRAIIISLSSLTIAIAAQSTALADGLNSLMRFNPRMAESFGQQVPPPPQNFYRGAGRYYLPNLPLHAVRPHRRHYRDRRQRFNRHHFGSFQHYGR